MYNLKKRLVECGEKQEYLLASFLFLIITLAFMYQLFLGKAYSPFNMYYHLLPWRTEYVDVKMAGPILSDMVDAFAPHIIKFREDLLGGRIALWSEFNAFGLPLDSVVGVTLTPIKLLFLVLPYQIAHTIDFGLRIFFRLLGMFTLLKGFKLNGIAAVVGAIVFSFCMPVVVWGYWDHTRVSTIAPWLLWSAVKAVGGDKKHIFIAGFLSYMMITAGMITYAIYYIYVVSFYLLFLLIKELIEKKDFGTIFLKGFSYGASMLIGLSMSALYILPFYKSMMETGYMAARSEKSLYNAFSVKNLILLFDSEYYNSTSNASIGNMNESSCFFGIISLLLLLSAIIYFIRTPKKKVLFWIGLLLFLVGITWNIPILSIMQYLPTMRSSSAKRLITPLIFVSSIIVAYFVNELLHSDNLKKKLLSLGGGGASILLLFIVGARAVETFEITKGIVFSTILLIAFYIMIVSHYTKKINMLVFSAILILAIVTDSFRAGIKYSPVVEFEHNIPNPQLKIADFLKENLNENRYVVLGKWAFSANTNVLYRINDLAAHDFTITDERIVSYLKKIDSEAYMSKTKSDINFVQAMNMLNLASVKDVLSEEALTYRNYPEEMGIGDRKAPIGKLIGGTVVSQKIYAPMENFSSITFLVATYQQVLESGSLSFKLYDMDGSVLRSGEIACRDFLDNSKYRIKFEPIQDSKNKYYTLVLESHSPEMGMEPTFWMHTFEEIPENPVILDGEPLAGQLVMQLSSRHPSLSSLIEHKEPKSGLYIYENPNVLPRAYLAGPICVMSDNDQILDEMSLDKNKGITYVNEEITGLTYNEEKIDNVLSLDIQGGNVSIETSSDRTRLLVLTDLYYADWHAYIDGVEIEIYPVNTLFRGVVVPEGEHLIEFKYKPKAFYLGATITIISFTVTIAAFLTYLIKSRKINSETQIKIEGSAI